jgi:putative transcriptional regulator
MREHTIKLLGEDLGREGFTAFVCPNSGGCFDVVARRELLLLIKVLQNIDAYTREQAEDLKNISGLLSAKGYLVGEQTKEFVLKDGVIYERHGIPASNLCTFRDFVFEGNLPDRRKFKRLGVRIDEDKLGARRRELNLTLEELSDRVGVAKKTLYRYEHGMTLAEEENVKKLELELGVELRKGIDPLMQSEPERTFEFHGFDAIETRAAPFQVLGRERGKEKDRVMMGKEADKRTMVKRADTYKRISTVF